MHDNETESRIVPTCEPTDPISDLPWTENLEKHLKPVFEKAKVYITRHQGRSVEVSPDKRKDTNYKKDVEYQPVIGVGFGLSLNSATCHIKPERIPKLIKGVDKLMDQEVDNLFQRRLIDAYGEIEAALEGPDGSIKKGSEYFTELSPLRRIALLDMVYDMLNSGIKKAYPSSPKVEEEHLTQYPDLIKALKGVVVIPTDSGRKKTKGWHIAFQMMQTYWYERGRSKIAYNPKDLYGNEKYEDLETQYKKFYRRKKVGKGESIIHPARSSVYVMKGRGKKEAPNDIVNPYKTGEVKPIAPHHYYEVEENATFKGTDLTEPLKKLIIRHEGFRNCMYMDTADPPKKTIGVGFNLEEPKMVEELKKYGLDIDKAKDYLNLKNYACLTKTGEEAKEARLDNNEIEEILKKEIVTYSREIKRFCSHRGVNFDELSMIRQMVLISMLFNMGSNSLRKFPSFFRALKGKKGKPNETGKDWLEAAFEMLEAKWLEDVKYRARELAYMMTHNKFPPKPFFQGWEIELGAVTLIYHLLSG